MLLLSRKRHQKIIINNEIVIEVKNITRNNVRLGITAPGTYTILREELSRRESPSQQTNVVDISSIEIEEQ